MYLEGVVVSNDVVFIMYLTVIGKYIGNLSGHRRYGGTNSARNIMNFE